MAIKERELLDRLKAKGPMTNKELNEVYKKGRSQLKGEDLKVFESAFKKFNEYNSVKNAYANMTEDNSGKAQQVISEMASKGKVGINTKRAFNAKAKELSNTGKGAEAVMKDMTEKEPPVFIKTDYEYKPTEAEMQGALAQAQRTNKAYFTREKQEYTQDYNRAKLDIERLVNYTNTEYVKDLANKNTAFARSVDKATNIYGQRGLLGSGIQKTQIGEATQDQMKQQENAEYYRKTKEEEYGIQADNLRTKYDRGMGDLQRGEETQIASDYYNIMNAKRNTFYGDTMGAENEIFRNYMQNQGITGPKEPYNLKDTLKFNTK